MDGCHEYVDPETGKIPDRGQLQQMFTAASQHKSTHCFSGHSTV